jgi:quercetin dioxygenase-like cupin family protein
MLSAMLAIFLFFTGAAVSERAAKPQAWDAANIPWQKIDTDGSKYAVLEGDRNLHGNFSYAVFLPAGVFEHHWHSGDARVFIVKGALKVGFSEHFDKSVIKSYPAGSFVFVPANAKHTMGADEDTLFFGTGVGPWVTHEHH